MMEFALLGIIGLAAILIVIMAPDIGVFAAIFVIYTNAAVVGYQLHGLPYIVPAAVPLLMVPALIRNIIGHRQQLIWHPILIPLFIYICIELISSIFAFNRAIGVENTVVLATEGLLLLFLITNVIRTEKDVNRAIWTVLIAGGMIGALLLYQQITNTLDNDYGGFARTGGLFYSDVSALVRLRQAGPLGEPNDFATVMVVLVPIGVFATVWWQQARRKVIAGVLTLLIVIAILLTYSRGGGILLLLMVFPLARFARAKPQYIVISGGVLTLLLIVIAPDYIGRILSLNGLLGIFQNDIRAVQDNAIVGRFSEGVIAFRMFLDHPILGVGPGNYPLLYASYARDLGIDGRILRNPHNMFLQLAAESGILGLGSFLAIGAAAYTALNRARKQYAQKHPMYAAFATALIISLGVRYLNGLWNDLSYERYLWLLIGLAMASTQIQFPVVRGERKSPAGSGAGSGAGTSSDVPRPPMRESLLGDAGFNLHDEATQPQPRDWAESIPRKIR
jgi:O-antigen ligase